MEIKKIAVVGAGTMGAGIAQVALTGGLQVTLHDLEEEYLQKGMGSIEGGLSRLVKKNRLKEEERAALLENITTTTSLADLGGVDMAIEAIIEDMGIKKDLYHQLDSLLDQEAILASNTSGLSITELASVTGRSSRVVGMHFFNPAPVMKLVEVVRGEETSRETLDTVMGLARELGKEPILVNEAPLFIVNRILVPMLNEAIFVLSEGTASREDIDKGMCLGANHPIGPLALADLIGLDVLLLVMETLYGETKDSKYRPAPLLKKKVRAGHLGRKKGRGFYEY